MQLYRGRINVLHLKDFTCKVLNAGPAYALIDADGNPVDAPSKEDNGFQFRPVGTGLQNFEEILACAKENGTEYVIVEQDQWYDNDSLEQIRISRENLKKLGL
jgi:sugar phosphate isomerase/epimerase